MYLITEEWTNFVELHITNRRFSHLLQLTELLLTCLLGIVSAGWFRYQAVGGRGLEGISPYPWMWDDLCTAAALLSLQDSPQNEKNMQGDIVKVRFTPAMCISNIFLCQK